MAIRAYVTTVDPKTVSSLDTEDGEILITLGSQEEAIAIQLQELFSSIAESVSVSLETESNLTIEITGSINFKVQGGVKYLFFNAGAETGTSTSMKVTLSTTLLPRT